MASFSGLAIGLSLTFGCFLLALIAELYYLLWWKKKDTNKREDVVKKEEEEEKEYNNNYYAKEFLHLICWKKQESLQNRQEQDLELGVTNIINNNNNNNSEDLVLKGFGHEENVDEEIMRLHNLSGPPRFLFTIKEETKEDLESEDGKSRKGSRTRSLSDILLTPLASPSLKSPSLIRNSSYSLDYDRNNGFNFNPLFESSIESEFYKMKSSPPPKFKFLRDAEEKLLRKLMNEAAKEEKELVKEGSFLGFIVNNKKKERDVVCVGVAAGGGGNLRQCPSCSSQVLPFDNFS